MCDIGITKLMVRSLQLKEINGRVSRVPAPYLAESMSAEMVNLQFPLVVDSY